MYIASLKNKEALSLFGKWLIQAQFDAKLTEMLLTASAKEIDKVWWTLVVVRDRHIDAFCEMILFVMFFRPPVAAGTNSSVQRIECFALIVVHDIVDSIWWQEKQWHFTGMVYTLHMYSCVAHQSIRFYWLFLLIFRCSSSPIGWQLAVAVAISCCSTKATSTCWYPLIRVISNRLALGCEYSFLFVSLAKYPHWLCVFDYSSVPSDSIIIRIRMKNAMRVHGHTPENRDEINQLVKSIRRIEIIIPNIRVRIGRLCYGLQWLAEWGDLEFDINVPTEYQQECYDTLQSLHEVFHETDEAKEASAVFGRPDSPNSACADDLLDPDWDDWDEEPKNDESKQAIVVDEPEPFYELVEYITSDRVSIESDERIIVAIPDSPKCPTDVIIDDLTFSDDEVLLVKDETDGTAVENAQEVPHDLKSVKCIVALNVQESLMPMEEDDISNDNHVLREPYSPIQPKLKADGIVDNKLVVMLADESESRPKKKTRMNKSNAKSRFPPLSIPVIKQHFERRIPTYSTDVANTSLQSAISNRASSMPRHDSPKPFLDPRVTFSYRKKRQDIQKSNM